MIPRTVLELTCRQLAPKLDGTLQLLHGERTGFVLMVFDFGDKGTLAYISNAERESMIGAVREWLARLEAGLSTDPPGPRKEA